VALVTGASSGFGLLTCIELARAGFRVFGSMRDLGRSNALEQAALAAGVGVERVAIDVTDVGTITTGVAEVVAKAGRIDVLVNNAGYGLGGFFEDVSDDELRAQFDTNFFGLAAMTRAVLPGMRERRQGRIINVSSIGGRVANPGLSAYSASKFAVEGLSESLRLELLEYGIFVVLIEPGTFKTDIFGKNRRLAKRAEDPRSPYYARAKQIEALVDRILARSKADPNDVALAIVHAAKAKAPRLRYLVGKDAHGEALAKAILPSKWFEAAVLKYIGKPGK
jgi:NAD(P)-dependent dehydrogenase (short-subunit alcohol dehydrogenase family)